MKLNTNFKNIKESYLFAEVANRAAAYSAANPDKKVLTVGGGSRNFHTRFFNLFAEIVVKFISVAVAFGNFACCRSGKPRGGLFCRQSR